MAPENTPHTQPDHQSEDPEILIDNAKVEDSSPQLPPYAYTVNGGVPPLPNQMSYYYPQAIYNPSTMPAYMPYVTGMEGLPNNVVVPSGATAYNTYPQSTTTTTEQQAQTTQQGQPVQAVFQYQNPIPQTQQAPFIPKKEGIASQSQSMREDIRYPNNEGTTPLPHDTQEATIFDYTYITSPARIAIYDDLKSAPRVIEITGAPTHEYIERIASLTYKHAKEEGGIIPYTVIREVSENFIHAQFQEIVVSIMDKGNTIRFADQGPGIAHKDLVQEPGFSSATEPMKRYIRGVGSGLPIVKDYLDTTHGYIEIEDNINKGSVVTISLVASRSIHDEQPDLAIPELTENEQRILQALLPDKALGITEIHNETGIAVASIHTALSKMEDQKLVEKINKKRKLTVFGERVTLSL